MGNRIEHKLINGIECKWCGKCQDWHPLENFTKSRTWDGLRSTCKEGIRVSRLSKPIVYNKEKQKEYNQSHKEEQTVKHREYRNNHKALANYWSRKAKLKRKRQINLPDSDLTQEQYNETLLCFNNECAYCGQTEDLTLDHVIPLSQGGLHTKDNVIPACRSCNSKKYTKELCEWYVNSEVYDEQRLNRILQYMDR